MFGPKIQFQALGPLSCHLELYSTESMDFVAIFIFSQPVLTRTIGLVFFTMILFHPWKRESEWKKWKYMVNVSVDAPEWKIWKLSWDTRFLCPQMESIFPKRVFSSQSNLPDWCCFIFGKSKLFKLNTRIKSEACTCMKIFSLR